MSFLPENYEAPKSSNNYLKLQDGENRIRILSRPIIGWEDWTPEKKPIRFRMEDKPSKSIDPKKPVRHFWSFVVFNVIEGKIQIMNVTQASIRKSIEGLSKDADWGSPYEYDIKIIKSGEGIDTEYVVNPVPHKPLLKEIVDAFDEMPCNLEALFTNDDPFSRDQIEKGVTKMGIDEAPIEKPKENKILYVNKNQLDEFLDAKNKLTEKDQEDVDKKLNKLGINNYSEIPLRTFELFMPSIISRIPVTA